MGLLIFLVGAYLMRANPINRAKGWHEIVIPSWCTVTPILLLETPFLHFLPPSWIYLFANTLHWKIAAFILLITGHTLTLIGFLYLGTAFSIFVQARHVVQRGPYRYIRHPIYVGESIAVVGIFLNVPNGINLVGALLWLIAQWTRARFEENKLAATFSSYTEYKHKTGSAFPRF